jgi:hypothetical protein
MATGYAGTWETLWLQSSSHHEQAMMRQVSVIGVRGLYCGCVCRRFRVLLPDSWQVVDGGRFRSGEARASTVERCREAGRCREVQGDAGTQGRRSDEGPRCRLGGRNGQQRQQRHEGSKGKSNGSLIVRLRRCGGVPLQAVSGTQPITLCPSLSLFVPLCLPSVAPASSRVRWYRNSASSACLLSVKSSLACSKSTATWATLRISSVRTST